MRTTTAIPRRLSLGPLLPLLLVASLIVSMTAETLAVSAAAPVSSTLQNIAAETVHRLDLSYLHRSKAGDLAEVIRGTLELQKEQEHPPTKEENDESAVVDIDLTASLIGKNLSEILSSLKRGEEESPSSLRGNTEAPPTVVRLTTRRNQWSPKEATVVLDFVSNNGPTNEIIAESDEQLTEENKTLDGNDKNATAAPGSLLASQKDTDSETTIALASDENITTMEETAEQSMEHKIATVTRPAFVTIQTLDLGWNNLGSDRTDGGPRRRGAASGVRLMNKALRKLLSSPKHCPRTIRLDVCGLGPSACRDMAKGMVERYQANGEDGQAMDRPIPLSLDLARNGGIGDVGVAALAAAIRTIATQQHGSTENASKGKKKRRRKKKRSKERPANNLEEGDGKEEDEDQRVSTDHTANDLENQSEETNAEGESPSTSAGATAAMTIFERLDLSGCGIGDGGAEALAIALKNNPLCIKHLDLSNNQISDDGAAALARVLGAEGDSSDKSCDVSVGCIQTLDLSYNKDLGDRGAKELARAFQGDGISNLILRSCNVRADGAASFAIALRTIGSQEHSTEGEQRRLIDLSGNPLGVLSKKKKSGGKYSASALKSKATDTTKAYMNIIGKSFQKGLSSINSLSNGEGYGMDTLESDDEEDERMNQEEDDSIKKCGALALALAFVENNDDSSETSEKGSVVHVELALRHCSFDTKAAEALAAVLQESRQNYPRMKLTMDMTMNDVLEEDIIAALHGEEGYDDQLVDMAEVYLDALEVMREARERALKAAQMAAARAKAQAQRESAWDAPSPGSRYDDDQSEEWSDETEDEHWDHPMSEDNYSDDDW
ncbi:unnamed protein product [Pseudo-nitzschia multistriata]|uniref:Uncharacterized protein n=1 Tax=Pseudo-nitzschia multistriata TaxID=183589 RepID=A0A448Z2S4_9STRA|nr:unnamed protein product [Pseudo-nitzschia multistriata]